MSNVGLPDKKVFSKAFAERGLPDVVKIDAFPIRDGDLISLTFESVSSPSRQGVWLKTDDCLIVNNRQCPSVELWQDEVPNTVLIECRTRNGLLHLYNIWDSGRGLGVESQSWSAGMLVEELSNGRRYRCNDIGFDTNFDKLVFRVERTGV